MKRLRYLLRDFWDWLLRQPRTRLVRVTEVPEKLDRHKLYLETEGGHAWLAAMLCPCGCGQTLHMSLVEDDSPRWEVTVHEDGTPSLHPSVWRRAGCRSHFFLIRGRVNWCD